jgi:hypothetical protein
MVASKQDSPLWICIYLLRQFICPCRVRTCSVSLCTVCAWNELEPLPLVACKIQTEDFLKMLFYTSRTGIVHFVYSWSCVSEILAQLATCCVGPTTKRSTVRMMLHYWGVCSVLDMREPRSLGVGWNMISPPIFVYWMTLTFRCMCTSNVRRMFTCVWCMFSLHMYTGV